MTLWVVKAEYPVGFGERTRQEGDEPVTRAKMLSAGSCGTTSSWLYAEVEAKNEAEAVSEAMVLIARQAAWFGVSAEPVVSVVPAAAANGELVSQ